MHPLEQQIGDIDKEHCNDCPSKYRCRYCLFNTKKRDLRRELAKIRKAQ